MQNYVKFLTQTNFAKTIYYHSEGNNDFGALINHFKTVEAHYRNRPNPHDRLFLDKSYQEAYEEHKDKIANVLLIITEMVADQYGEGLEKFVETF